jgi:ribosomal protein S18 acetylase RimI-like enzyme
MITVRKALATDCAFIAGIILEAETSGAEITSYEKMFQLSSAELQEIFSKALETSPAGHALTWQDFLIATENEIPVAGLSAYIEGSNGDSSHLTTAVLMNSFPRKQLGDAFRFLRQHEEVSIPKTNHTLQLDCVATLPAHRGKGALRLLMDAALKDAKNKGAALAEIQVWKKNASAIATYEKLGFHSVTEKPSHTEAGNGKVLMQKEL